MSSDSKTRSPVLRFLDSFLQDRNIVWMLGLGTAIFLVSSLFLVARHWTEATPLWKYGTLLVYTCGAYGAGEVARRRLALRHTSTVLQALTIVLLPITFVALRWFEPAGPEADAMWTNELPHLAGWLGLCAFNLFVSQWIARRVFAIILRGDQPTFVFSYLLLSLAGAVVPAVAIHAPTAFVAVVAFGLWGLFTVGTIKVNRHVFWLTEEQRLPRVFGFFPIALLGTQFLLLFCGCLAPRIDLPWIGLGCELVAVTVLLTADTIARIHEQRTGGLIRPWPWSLVVPFLLGIGLSAAGLVLAATQLPAPPQALVPAAVLAAMIAGVAARRTKQSQFVWAMLVAIVIAYNFSPSYFLDLARAVIQSGAAAVRESKLPYPLYGLTYLPLLIALTAVAVWRRNSLDELFARPIRLFTIGLTTLLLIASLGHVKAMFLVPAAMTVFFAGQVIALRDRRLMILSIAAFILAAAGFTPFASGVLMWAIPAGFPTFCLGLAAALLLWPGAELDRVSTRFSPSPRNGERGPGGEGRASLGFHNLETAGTCAPHPRPLSPSGGEGSFDYCQVASLLLTLALLPWWGLERIRLDDLTQFRIADWTLAAFLFVQAVRWIKPGLGELAFGFGGLVCLLNGIQVGLPWPTLLSCGTFFGLGVWLIARGLEGRSHLRLARALVGPAYRVSVAMLLGLLLLHHAPSWFWGTLDDARDVDWSSATLILVWAFDAACRLRSRILTTCGALGVLLLEGAGLTAVLGTSIAFDWLPAVWAFTAALTVPGLVRGQHATHEFLRAVVQPLRLIVLAVLAISGGIACVWFGLPQRLAGGVVIAALVWMSRLEANPTLRRLATILANWLVLSLVVQWLVPGAATLAELTSSQWLDVFLPLALTAAASVALWQRVGVARPDQREGRGCATEKLFLALSTPIAPLWACHPDDLAAVQRELLRLVVGLCLVGPMQNFEAGLSVGQAVLVVVTLATLTATELWAACRDQIARRVWFAEALVAIAVGYLALFGVIEFGHGLAMFVVLGCGLLAALLSNLTSRNARTAICSQPFGLTGLWLPMVAVGLGLIRHLAYAQPAWKGMNSLALLIAAGFYFWRGLERGEKRWVVTAAVILDIALALLWRELHWTDAQLFLVPVGLSVLGVVELLKNEIPQPAHTPLRYVGALVILVSPTFDVVSGSWLHILCLMVSSVALTLLAMGLRVRALMYTGTAFLVADLLAMLVHGSLRHPDVLWLAGLLLGAAVLSLAAFCENHRELLHQRLRLLAAELEAWE
jgi:hypothetical protein